MYIIRPHSVGVGIIERQNANCLTTCCNYDIFQQFYIKSVFKVEMEVWQLLCMYNCLDVPSDNFGLGHDYTMKDRLLELFNIIVIFCW